MFKGLLRQISKEIKGGAIALLEKCIPAYHNKRSIQFAMDGLNLTDAQVAAIEKKLEVDPGYIIGRILLLGKYGDRQFQPNNSEGPRSTHVEWIVRNHPEHPIAGSPFVSFDSYSEDGNYQRIKDIWVEQTERCKDWRVLLNASKFFIHADKELAEQCLLKALEIKPAEMQLKTSLAFLYSLWDGHADQSLAQLEELSKKPDSEEVFYELTDLPEVAIKAGQFEKAVSASQRLLAMSAKYRKNWNYGNAVNKAHTALGGVAFKNGEVEKAKFHLEQSIIDIATPQTTSFGPSLDLARDLVRTGEKEAVLKYLDQFELLCGVNNRWAFEVRFAAEHGLESMPTDTASEKSYEEAFREHQFRALEARTSEDREEHLRELIERTRSRIDRWSQSDEQTKEQESAELKDYEEHTWQLEQELLRKLESLLADDDEKK